MIFSDWSDIAFRGFEVVVTDQNSIRRRALFPGVSYLFLERTFTSIKIAMQCRNTEQRY